MYMQNRVSKLSILVQGRKTMTKLFAKILSLTLALLMLAGCASTPVTVPSTVPSTEPQTVPVTTPVTVPTTTPATEPQTVPATTPVTVPATTPATEPQTVPATTPVTVPNAKHDAMYKKAIRLIESGNYEESYFLFKEIVDFRDSRDYLSHFKICFDTKIFTGTNGSVVTTTHTYDSQGGLVKTVRSQAGEIWTHTYNGKGLLLEEKNEVMGEEFGYTHTIAYVYDNYGNLTEKLETTSDSNGNTDKDTVIYTRDNRGNVIKEVHTDIDGWVTTTTCTYDDLDNLLKKEEAFVGDHGTSLPEPHNSEAVISSEVNSFLYQKDILLLYFLVTNNFLYM